MGTRSEHRDLIRLIARRFAREGWNAVDTGRLRDGGGVCPDILLERKGSWLAVCIGSLPDVFDRKTADRWEELLGHDRMKLMVAVLDRKALKAARAAAAARGLDVDVRYFRKRRHRANTGNGDLFESRRGFEWGAVVAGAIMLIVFLLLMSPIIRDMLHINDFYRPFDRERQIQLQEQQEQD